jgi:glycopeptide antibiotics resistance protein
VEDTPIAPWRELTPRAKIETIVIRAVFVLYLLFLLKLLLLSRAAGAERSINLLPFASIVDYALGSSRLALGNVAGNVLAFIPLGAYLPLLRGRTRIGSNLLIVAMVSVAVEIVQGVFALGASDIDDVILNSTGGLIGILCFRMLRSLAHDRDRTRTIMAVLAVIASPVLGWLMLAIRLRF